MASSADSGGPGVVAARLSPGWGWIVTPIMPTMPVNAGELLALIAVVVGLYGGLVWFRNNL